MAVIGDLPAPRSAGGILPRGQRPPPLRIAYRLPGVAPGGRLAWDAVGTSWPVEIGAVELHVVAPFRLVGARLRPGRHRLPGQLPSQLIGAAVDGYLELEETDGAVTLIRLPRRPGAATYLLDEAFAGRDRLALGSYDPSFASAWRQVGAELAGWRKTSVLWDPAGDRRRALARSLGVVAGLAGLLLTALGAGLAVGELRHWSRAVAASSVGATDPAEARYPLLAPASFTDTSRAATKPSSGGSGGGGVGGGSW